MVTINLTLLVELLLFLGFLWLVHRYIVVPVLQNADAREAEVEQDQTTAVEATEASESLEREYRRKRAALHREASQRIAQAHREAQRKHLDRMAELKAEEEKQIVALRNELRQMVDQQRDDYDRLSRELAEVAAERLGLSEVRS